MFDSCFPCITPFYYNELIDDISLKAKEQLKKQETRNILINFLGKHKRKKRK